MELTTRFNDTNLTLYDGTNNVTKDKFDVWAMQTVRTIYIYYTPLLIILGSIGNFVSTFVFYATKLRLQSTSQYLSALALSDTLFLLLLLPPWLGAIQINGLFHRRGFCQVFTYTSYVTCCTSAWLVVAFTVERFVAVLYPLRRNAMCTVARARHIIGSIMIGAVLINIPLLRFAVPINDDCNIDREYLEHAARFNIIDTILSFTIPLAVIIVLNVSIMLGVYKLERARHQLIKAEHPPLPLRARPARFIACPRSQQKVTRMLLIVSSVFVTLNLPAYTMRVLAYAFDMSLEESGGRWMALQQLAVMFFNSNFGINFLLYCLSGQNFRKALYNTMPWVRRRARRGIAARLATSVLQARISSVSSTSAFFVSNGTEGIPVNTVSTKANNSRRRDEKYISRWTFDNSRQRRSDLTMPSTAASLHNEALEMRVFNLTIRTETSHPYFCTTQL